MNDDSARAVLLACFRAAVASADPAVTLAQHLPEPPKGRLVIVGAGKSAAAMARAAERAYAGQDPGGERSGTR
jgi:glycerate-2-kinase